jgi:biopolymer transport protein ExbD
VKLTKHKRPTRAQMNMTPMIDIVFLLIIFFMTVTQVSKINKEQLPLPQQKGAEDQQEANITVNVNRDGQVIVSGNQYSVPQLVFMIDEEFRRVDRDARRMTIVLRVHQKAASKTANEIVSSLGRLGITKVTIAVQVPEG